MNSGMSVESKPAGPGSTEEESAETEASAQFTDTLGGKGRRVGFEFVTAAASEDATTVWLPAEGAAGTELIATTATFLGLGADMAAVALRSAMTQAERFISA